MRPKYQGVSLGHRILAIVEQVNLGLITTRDLVEGLRRLGLDVSEKQLANDTADRFLPPRRLGPVREGRGRTGLWEPWMVHRAERLYRLRRHKDADGQPLVYGDTLRILLFIRDGWGWAPDIRELALTAYDKCLAANLAPVRRYVRGEPDREKIEFALDAHDVTLVPAERYATGMAAVGQPLEGGSLKGVFRAAQAIGLASFPPSFVKLFAPLGIHDSVDLAATLSTSFSGGGHEMIKSLLENLSDRDAHDGVPAFIGYITRMRRGVHAAAIAEGKKGQPTSPLSCFGFTQRRLEREFRAMKMPQRVTPAQWLALMIGVSVISDQFLSMSERMVAYAFRVAERLGMQPPSQEEQLLPYTIDVMQRVFGVNPFMQQTVSPK